MTDDAWNEGIGTIWSALLTQHGLDPEGVVIEIGPGFEDKIGRGLAKCQFRGTLFVVEPCATARRYITTRYRTLLPHAAITPIADPIPAATARLPGHVDAVLLNHVLDDLLLFASLPHEERDLIFSRMRADDAGAALAVRAWRMLLDDPDTLRTLQTQVISDIVELVRQTAPQLIGVSHYESWRQRSHGLGRVDELGVDIMHTLASTCFDTPAAARAVLERHGHDPARWIVSSGVRPHRRTSPVEQYATAAGRSA